ncbi:TasA family protein [Halobaculum limi]|uniref:TasA family protein n=1 Tax=Halobaculum limi TaxID=3031916 RepID=UPI00240622D8|nr:TasA family protein [Halobaculum sp. YSMS11]
MIGATSAASGLGTWALLSDTEQTTGSVTTGTLDLRVGDDGTATIAIEDVEPGDAGISTVPVSNHGTVAGTLGLTVVDVRPNDSDGDSNPDTDKSGGPIAGIEFNGCGTADVEFAADAAFPISIEVHTRTGESNTSVETRTIEKSDTKSKTGGRPTTKLNGNGGLVAVSIDGQTWANPNPCVNDDARNDAASVALAKALTVDIGYADDKAAAGTAPLVEADPVWDLAVPKTAESDRTLSPGGEDDAPGSHAVLYVEWSVDADSEESIADGTVEIELQPVIHT